MVNKPVRFSWIKKVMIQCICAILNKDIAFCILDKFDNGLSFDLLMYRFMIFSLFSTFAVAMGRIMAIDYGRKRCGIAVTDELRMIASPYDTVLAHQLEDFLKKYFSENLVDIVVIGLPVDMKGDASESEKYIQPFLNRFKKLFPEKKLERFDERFTSKMALQAMITAGSKKSDRRDKGNIDKVSAAIILQDYLQYAMKD
jgi:putative Holliday junction resolvase